MATVFVLYPAQFNCYSKFERKLDRILSQLTEMELICEGDPNGLVRKFCTSKSVDLQIVDKWEKSNITHAVVFDDGEVYPKQIELLKARNIPCRLINIQITRVININREKEFKGLKSTPNFEYIGRGSYWGNPYSMYAENEDREEVIRLFKYDFEHDKFPRKKKIEVYKLAGKRLGCFCKPEACHGDVLADFLNSWDDGK